MTTYGKIENNKLITASNNLGITGLADSPELCKANGFTDYTEAEISGYFSGSHQIVDGVLTDITDTTDYKNKIKKEKKSSITSEYKEWFKELDITYTRLVTLGTKTITEYKTARASLQSELATKLTEV